MPQQSGSMTRHLRVIVCWVGRSTSLQQFGHLLLRYAHKFQIYFYLLPFCDNIQASGQRIEYFESTQLHCGLEEALKIPLHCNIRWGTAYKMLEQSHKLRQASILTIFSLFRVLTSRCEQRIALFLASADEMYGPITTLRRDNRISKHIPRSAFKLTDLDWTRVVDARDILGVSIVNFTYIFHSFIFIQDSNRIQEYFSSEKQPTLWRALPALEELQTAWETKRDSPRYALYKDALNEGLAKIRKYYTRLDQKPSFVLALGKTFLLSPFIQLFKLDY